MTSIRIHAKNEQFKKYIENTVNTLSNSPSESVRVSTRLAKWILTDYPTLISNGKTYSTQVRNVGAGVKELYLEEKR